MRRVELGAAATLLAMLLAGCVQPTDPSPSASPSPTFMCTPEAGGDQAPCSEADYQKMKEKDALYAEAEQVYRKYTTLLMREMKAGGATRLPAELEALISGQDLNDSVLKRLREVRKEGLVVKGADVRIAWARRLPSLERDGSTVTMRLCGDASKLKAYKDGELVASGVVSEETVFFAGKAGDVTMLAIEYQDVKKC